MHAAEYSCRDCRQLAALGCFELAIDRELDTHDPHRPMALFDDTTTTHSMQTSRSRDVGEAVGRRGRRDGGAFSVGENRSEEISRSVSSRGAIFKPSGVLPCMVEQNGRDGSDQLLREVEVFGPYCALEDGLLSILSNSPLRSERSSCGTLTAADSRPACNSPMQTLRCSLSDNR